MRLRTLLASIVLLLSGCPSDPACTRNSECAAGSYCSGGMCASDCTPETVEDDCGAGANCNTFGMCVSPPDAGPPPDAARSDGGVDAPDLRPACVIAGGTDADGDGFCTGTTVGSDCDDTNPAVHPGATEVCNGTDDDCSGGPDDIAAMTCSTACGSGPLTCVSGAPVCAAPMPATEVCNHMDDDCDTSTDEGFPAVQIGTAFSTLASYGPGCSTSYGCNQSVHGFCSVGADRCGQSGFGPVEFAGDGANVMCVESNLQTTNFAELATHHTACDGSDPDSIQCLAAVNRLCAARGLGTGFGPVAVSAPALTVACVPTAVGVGTSYTALAAVHPNCNAGARTGFHCVHAIHHFCINNGYRTGFGPLEHGGDAVTIACIP